MHALFSYQFFACNNNHVRPETPVPNIPPLDVTKARQ